MSYSRPQQWAIPALNLDNFNVNNTDGQRPQLSTFKQCVLVMFGALLRYSVYFVSESNEAYSIKSADSIANYIFRFSTCAESYLEADSSSFEGLWLEH
jgi:hypothetical protein